MCGLLKLWRENAGMTQRDLAKILRKPHSLIYRIETQGRRIDPIEFVAWCRATGVKPSDAIDEIVFRRLPGSSGSRSSKK
jgi:transcriptional regulator with XRE-family HTH domain